jgi:hypothetical protein
MTYYEELGVAEGSSIAEIRHAYRRLVRLIHPDQCTDDATRCLAELQMKRLNGVLALLTDESHRTSYDESLSPARLPCAPAFDPNRDRKIASILCILLISLTLLAWPRVTHVPPPEVPSQLAILTAPPAKKQRPTPIRPQPRPAAPATRSKPLPEPPLPAEPELPPPPPVIETIPAAIAPPEAPARPTLAGRWLFVPSTATRPSGYPPEFIELRLTDSAGVLHGRYHARYRVTDRAISPEVDFRFDGRPGTNATVLDWQGSGGAQGEITLRLLPAGTLEVDWVARQLGHELGLISGTATLVRKLE